MLLIPSRKHDVLLLLTLDCVFGRVWPWLCVCVIQCLSRRLTGPEAAAALGALLAASLSLQYCIYPRPHSAALSFNKGKVVLAVLSACVVGLRLPSLEGGPQLQRLSGIIYMRIPHQSWCREGKGDSERQ